MRPIAEYRNALRLIENGWNSSAISRETGIPRSTIRDWKLARETGRPRRTPAKQREPGCRPNCPICETGTLDQNAYGYLFGLYLGDGYLSRQGQDSWRLRIVQDLRYPNLIEECAAAMASVRGMQRISFQSRYGYQEIGSSWMHWLCLFPQHGPGPKHRRSIVLDPWQRSIVTKNPQPFVRGLIHSDGSRYVNTVFRRVSGLKKKYTYVNYSFSNRSAEVLDIMSDALDLIGVAHRRYPSSIAVTRRASVSILDRFVGPKT